MEKHDRMCLWDNVLFRKEDGSVSYIVDTNLPPELVEAAEKGAFRALQKLGLVENIIIRSGDLKRNWYMPCKTMADEVIALWRLKEKTPPSLPHKSSGKDVESSITNQERAVILLKNNLNISIKELADILGLHRSTLYKWLEDERSVFTIAWNVTRGSKNDIPPGIRRKGKDDLYDVE